MYGNNFGLFGGRRNGRRLLRSLRPLADRIVATSNDPYATQDPAHPRLSGAEPSATCAWLRIRIRYRDLVDPWFDYLLPSPREIEEPGRRHGGGITAAHPR